MKPLDHHNFSHAEMACLSGTLSGMALGTATRLMTMPHQLRLCNLDPTGNWIAYKTVASPGGGGTNLDGAVDYPDLIVLSQNYGKTANVDWCKADFTGNGTVDFDDQVILSQNYGASGWPVALTRHYYYDAACRQLEERIDSASTAQSTHVWGVRYIDELVSRDETVSGTTTRVFVCQDANFNVTSLVDAGGSPISRWTYEAYGKPTIHNGSWGTGGADVNFLFGGTCTMPQRDCTLFATAILMYN